MVVLGRAAGSDERGTPVRSTKIASQVQNLDLVFHFQGQSRRNLFSCSLLARQRSGGVVPSSWQFPQVVVDS